MQKYEHVSRLLIEPISITYLHVAVNFDATKLLQNCVQKYEPDQDF